MIRHCRRRRVVKLNQHICLVNDTKSSLTRSFITIYTCFLKCKFIHLNARTENISAALCSTRTTKFPRCITQTRQNVFEFPSKAKKKKKTTTCKQFEIEIKKTLYMYYLRRLFFGRTLFIDRIRIVAISANR